MRLPPVRKEAIENSFDIHGRMEEETFLKMSKRADWVLNFGSCNSLYKIMVSFGSSSVSRISLTCVAARTRDIILFILQP